MTTPKLYALKGDFAWRPVGAVGVYAPFLNATDAKISMSIETIKQKSNGDEPGTIAEDEVGREATFEASFQSKHKENMKKFLFALSTETPASTAPVAFTLPAGPAGSVVNLEKNNITAATFGALVAGADYKLKAKSGGIVYLAEIPETVGTLEHGAFTNLGIFSAPAIEIELFFTSEVSGTSYEIYRLKLSPAQAMQLVSDGNEYGSATLSGTLLAKTGVVSDATLGKYGRVRTFD
jgi:hypothetical protein